MSISISSSPSSFSFGNLQQQAQSAPQKFTFTAKDPVSTKAVAVQFKVEAFTSSLSQFLLQPGSDWTPSSGNVTSAISPVFTYGPSTKAGKVELNVICVAGIPTGLGTGHLVLTLLKDGVPIPSVLPLQVDLSVNVVMALPADAVAAAAGAMASV